MTSHVRAQTRAVATYHCQIIVVALHHVLSSKTKTTLTIILKNSLGAGCVDNSQQLNHIIR